MGEKPMQVANLPRARAESSDAGDEASGTSTRSREGGEPGSATGMGEIGLGRPRHHHVRRMRHPGHS